ncbi:site-specific integrase [uncultured Deefgea sp.]|uniref:site-specific integrase n=1 Tax=uncultured Deefgea sp. TaxID=1304914 RepID=UPI002592704F|nr:site-specific integrase [uncultured Deefgea sp.]
MGQIRTRKETGKLYFDFVYNGTRCREQTNLLPSTNNLKKLQKMMEKIELEIQMGRFEYQKHFPNSRLAAKFSPENPPTAQPAASISAKKDLSVDASKEPFFSTFIVEWLQENQISWRRSHLINIKGMIDKYYNPGFGHIRVGAVTRADLLKFRSSLAKVSGRNGNVTLSANRINKIMDPLRRIFEEAADRYDFTTPFVRIKPLKVPRSDVQPFTLTEVRLIIDSVRPDFKNYYTVRFFSGMRTGEIDGLKWKYVDFERRVIKVRETIVAGEEDYTKTDSSQRDIAMCGPVFDALQNQYLATGAMSEYVFCNLQGLPVDHNNITKRVWYPLLAHIGLEKRRPYQTRHTAATLWLAAGEAPEWIARQMGHANTEMLFKVYSRYVPNLTRRDGSAFERLLLQGQVSMPAGTADVTDQESQL